MSTGNNWNTYHMNHAGNDYPSDPLIRFCAHYLYGMDRGNTRVLEVGCGTGVNVWYLAREGFITTYGVDSSDVAVDKARERLARDRLTAVVRVADVRNLPFPPDNFDTVIDEACLYCLSKIDTRKALNQIYRVLTPGGYFYSRRFAEPPPYDAGFTPTILDEDAIEGVYGAFFDFVSVDILHWTNKNKWVTEWVLTCRK